MSADGDAMPKSQLDGAPHGIGIACMATAGDIGRTDKWKDRLVGDHPFSHIAIEIDPQHTISLR
jgi:hypothetical protein